MSVRLPEPPSAEFLRPDLRDIIAHLQARERWARDLVRTVEAAIDQLSVQAGLGWTVANPTANRTLDSAADTAAQVRDQLGTLVSDLKQRSIIG